jgi:hypothetical protein
LFYQFSQKNRLKITQPLYAYVRFGQINGAARVGQIYNGALWRGAFWLIIKPGFWIGTGGMLGWVGALSRPIRLIHMRRRQRL